MCAATAASGSCRIPSLNSSGWERLCTVEDRHSHPSTALPRHCHPSSTDRVEPVPPRRPPILRGPGGTGPSTSSALPPRPEGRLPRRPRCLRGPGGTGPSMSSTHPPRTGWNRSLHVVRAASADRVERAAVSSLRALTGRHSRPQRRADLPRWLLRNGAQLSCRR